MQWRGIAVGVVAGALAATGGLWVWSKRPAGPAPSPIAASAGSLEEQLASLRAELAAERDARLGLSAEVEMLRVLLEDGGVAPGLGAPPAGTDVPAASGAAAVEPTPAGAPGAGGPDAVARSWFDAQGLIDDGVSSADVDRLQSVFEESELQALYLRDRATREGWVATPRFAQEMIAQRMGLRANLGDENFDQLLYATHRTNRVRARAVLASGPAARAGIRSGDLILRYDGKTIFKMQELQQATSLGEAGRMVPVDVMSDGGGGRRVMVPSGPLGVQLGEERLPPQSTR